MRRHRALKRQGAAVVAITVGADAIESLAALGWLDPARSADKAAVQSAVIAIAAKAIWLRVTPSPK